MCGIAGFVGSGSTGHLDAMMSRMVHRGPDGEGTWIDENVGVYLGHRRLSIVDLSGGLQPMASADGRYVITFNGEIYNHAQLRAELLAQGARFRTDHSDTETLLEAYRAWGPACLDRLNGMWAFAIYDSAKQELFCSRDRFGKKPFFYSFQNGTFAFGSELGALLRAPGMRASISRTALQKYFGYGYIPAPHSLYENVWKLPAGFSLHVDARTLAHRIERYWDFRLESSESAERTEDEWCEELRWLLREAVRRRLMSDVPLGVFLSGGVDSSSVAAFAAELLPPGQLKTFSIGFQEDSFDESPYARRVADLLGTDHHVQTLSAGRARELIPEILARLDEPMGDSSLIPTYLLCQHTRQHVTVALGGDGADELFAGYDPFRALSYAHWYSRLVPRPVHAGIRMLMARLPVSHGNMSLDFRIKRTLRGLSHAPALWSPVWMAPLDARDLEELFEEPIDTEELYSEAIQQWDECNQPGLIDRTLQFYTKLYLQDDILVKVDRASMMVSLEARCPYLDIDLVNLVRRMPPHLKFRRGRTKYILKKALEPLLPVDILHRTKKGFGLPIGSWMAESKLDLSAEDAAGVTGVFGSSDFGRRKLESHRAGRSDERAFLWNLLLLREAVGQQKEPAFSS